jgi:hypothetical protein
LTIRKNKIIAKLNFAEVRLIHSPELDYDPKRELLISSTKKIEFILGVNLFFASLC